jgi:hypothetical protein
MKAKLIVAVGLVAIAAVAMSYDHPNLVAEFHALVERALAEPA